MSEQKLIWPQAARLDGTSDATNYPWHRAINQHADEIREAGGAHKDWPKFMYNAKTAAQELPRLALLFEYERTDKLQKAFRRCSCCTESRHVVDNHLTCCLGKECRKCPHLAALDKAELSPEMRDWTKAWTCVAHILASGGDLAGEGFITTVDDRMYWDSVHESLAAAHEEEDGADE